MKESKREIVGWAGALLACAGLGWIYPPLTPISLGCFLIFLAARGR
jgi:hypothetical protein